MKSIFKLVFTGCLALSLSYSVHILGAESRSIILPGGATTTTDTTVSFTMHYQ